MIIGSTSKFHGTMMGRRPDATIVVTDVYIAQYPKKTGPDEIRTMVAFTLIRKEPCDPKDCTSFGHTDHLETFLNRIKGFHKVN